MIKYIAIGLMAPFLLVFIVSLTAITIDFGKEKIGGWLKRQRSENELLYVTRAFLFPLFVIGTTMLAVASII